MSVSCVVGAKKEASRARAGYELRHWAFFGILAPLLTTAWVPEELLESPLGPPYIAWAFLCGWGLGALRHGVLGYGVLRCGVLQDDVLRYRAFPAGVARLQGLSILLGIGCLVTSGWTSLVFGSVLKAFGNPRLRWIFWTGLSLSILVSVLLCIGIWTCAWKQESFKRSLKPWASRGA